MVLEVAWSQKPYVHSSSSPYSLTPVEKHLIDLLDLYQINPTIFTIHRDNSDDKNASDDDSQDNNPPLSPDILEEFVQQNRESWVEALFFHLGIRHETFEKQQQKLIELKARKQSGAVSKRRIDTEEGQSWGWRVRVSSRSCIRRQDLPRMQDLQRHLLQMHHSSRVER